jgi:predicted cobalt transporter CbtA
MFRRIVFTAALSWLVAGLVISGVQLFQVIPLIHEAKTYEAKPQTSPLCMAS